MSSTSFASPPKGDIQRIFDSIAFRYDFLNTFLSLKLDDMWRRRSRDLMLEGCERSILDLGVGTGKFLQSFLSVKSFDRAVGLDFSAGMLEEARRHLPASVELVNADFHNLPFEDRGFDLVISAFTLRSVKEMPHFLAEVYRILKPEGKAGFLCLTRPKSIFWKILYYPYLNFYLPVVGRLLSGNWNAYRFLSESIQTFQDPSQTKTMMADAGFRDVRIHAFTFGAATLILGKK
ncbi:MAG: ubiquinone/menaquinone biosynthesis methyltransferase [Candidatus Omnitrophica bacterium]|nr:ubiquinone/menaquinone biosynthesis methyltransferase [Candidatus Omnitrophota bacterium]